MNRNKMVIDARMIATSGIGRYVQQLIVALQGMGEYDIILLGKPEELTAFSQLDGIAIRPFRYAIYSIKEQFFFIFCVPVCDLFISPHYNVPFFLPQAGKRVVIIPDVNHLVFKQELSLLKRVYAKYFYAMAISKSDLIFTISDFSKMEVKKYIKKVDKEIIVAHLAIDKNYFSLIRADQNNADSITPAIKKLSETAYVLFVGNVKPHKNLKRSLLAFEKVAAKHPDLKFVIVGKKEKLITIDTEIFDLIEQHAILKERVILTGKIADTELAFLYKNASCLLFASLYEGFGIPPLEAMFFNCPVISSEEGSLPEICGDAVLYCNAFNIDDISEKITLLLTNNALRLNLIEKGQAKVNAYDWNNFSKKIIENICLMKNK